MSLKVQEWEFLSEYSPDELPVLAGGWKQQDFLVGQTKFRLIRPADPDLLLDTPETLEAHASYGYMPYWGYLWPTSLDMARYILDSNIPAGVATLEIGAGIGLAGLAGLARGWDVTFSDYDRMSVQLALTNARLNGFSNFQGAFLDWRTPPEGEFPLILGCDIIYENQNHELVLNVLDHLLAGDGECWLADPQRHQSERFVALAKSRNYLVEKRQVTREPFPTRPAGITDIWVVRKTIDSMLK